MNAPANANSLITMANQIGAFFASMPDRDAAVVGVADHIRRFWAPRMRHGIYAVLDAAQPDASGLAPIVVDALTMHRATLEPA